MTLASISIGASEVVYRGVAIASDPSVVRMGDSYLMFYTDLREDGLATSISAARSTDGINWTAVTGHADQRGNILAGPTSFETVNAVMIGAQLVLYVSEYDEAAAAGLGARITAYVVNSDFSVQPFAPDAVISPDANGFDANGAYSPTVIAHDGGYVMYYVGHDYDRPESVGVTLLSATSVDGINWTRSTEPVLSPGDGPSWASLGFAEPSVVVGPDGRVHMFYTALDGENRCIGYAVADHPGGVFEFSPEPLVTVADVPGSPAQILAPSAIIENGQLALWYFAYSEDQGYRIVHATGAFEVAPPADSLEPAPVDPAPEMIPPDDEFVWVDPPEQGGTTPIYDPDGRKYPTCIVITQTVSTDTTAADAVAPGDKTKTAPASESLHDAFIFETPSAPSGEPEYSPLTAYIAPSSDVIFADQADLWLL